MFKDSNRRSCSERGVGFVQVYQRLPDLTQARKHRLTTYLDALR